MRGFLSVAAMNLPEPSGSSPPEKPPGSMRICALLMPEVIACTDSSTACGVRLRMTSASTSPPAFSKARCVSYSQLMPGKTGMKMRGFV